MIQTEHFSHEELRCSHCGENRMDAQFLELLEELRVRHGRPMLLSSAYRCPEHNQAVSTTGPDGPHTTGKAVDVLVHTAQAHRLLALATLLGFRGIGLKQHGPWGGRFIHLDDLGTGKRPWVWTYGGD